MARPQRVKRKDCIAPTFRQMRRRLQNLGMKYQDAVALAGWYNKNLNARGAVGALDLFKRVGSQVHYSVTGLGNPQAAWVRTYGPRRIPRIILPFFEDYPTEFWLRFSKFSRAIKLKEIQTSQVDKVYNAIVAPYSGVHDGIDNLCSIVDTGLGMLPTIKPRLGKPSLVTRQFRRVVSVSGVTPVVDEPPILESLAIVARNPWLRECFPYWADVFNPLTPTSANRLVDMLILCFSTGKLTQLRDRGVDPDVVGFYSYSQEGGGKLRAFASPFVIFQCLLDPIRDYITDVIKVLKTDCTFDQDSGAKWAQSKLRSGKTVHSVDLSTATCRFPLEPQLRVLQGIGLPDRLLTGLFRVIQGKWIVHDDFKPFNVPDYVQWAVGQPLGISPSIRMFSLTHNLLLAGLCKEFGLKPSDTYRVLGDDVVIADDQVHQRYMKVISDAGIPISHDKSWDSDMYAEFAGYQITRKTMIRPGQWHSANELNHLGVSLHLQVPLNGELSASLLLAEKINLFREGLFRPPSTDLHIYLKANYLLSGWEGFLGYPCLSMDSSPTWWGIKICEVIRSQCNHPLLNGLIQTYSFVPNYAELASVIPLDVFPTFVGRKLSEYRSFKEFLLWIYALLLTSHVSWDDRKRHWDNFIAKVKSVLWSPPVSISKEIKSESLRVLKAVSIALEHTELERVDDGLSGDHLHDSYVTASYMGLVGSHVVWGLNNYNGDPYDPVRIRAYLESVGAL